MPFSSTCCVNSCIVDSIGTNSLLIYWLEFLTLVLDLLEKSRCVRQALDERIFHFYYQMLNGCNEEKKSKWITVMIVWDVSTVWIFL